MKKKVLAILLSAVMTLGLFAGCSGDEDTASGSSDTLKIGIIQYATHPSLDNCYEGIIAGLKEAGYVDGDNITIDFKNAQSVTENSDLMAKNMVTAKYDMIIAIATPAAMSAYSFAKESDVPVVFSAVSDPVSPGLVNSLEDPGTGATGTSDALNLEGQVKMIRAFLPDADTIGVLYTTSELNSLTHLAMLQEIAPNYGFTVEAQGVTDGSEVAAGITTLISKNVDCINNFTDNNVVDNLTTVLNASDRAGIPVFGSEEEQVVNGCLASETLDYVELGKATGKMAADILSGNADVKTLPVTVVSDSEPVYSKTVLEKLSLTLPEEYASARNVAE